MTRRAEGYFFLGALSASFLLMPITLRLTADDFHFVLETRGASESAAFCSYFRFLRKASLHKAAARFATLLRNYYRLRPPTRPIPRISPPPGGSASEFHFHLHSSVVCFDSRSCQKGRRPAASPRTPLWHIRFAYSCT